jgi:hypothetical protein
MPVFITISRVEKIKGKSPDCFVARWQDANGRLRKTHEGIAAIKLISHKEIEEFRYNPPARLALADRLEPTGGQVA